MHLGIVLGPSVLGKWTTYYNFLFHASSITYLDLVANIGLQLYLFIVGLELNLHFAFVNWRSSAIIAISSIVIPFLAGLGVSVIMYKYLQDHPNIDSNVPLTYAFFIGTAMSITAVPILARIIKENELQNTIVGNLTISAATFNDAVAWILLIIAISLSSSQESSAGWVCLAAAIYITILFTVGRNGFSRLVAHLERDDPTPSDAAAMEEEFQDEAVLGADLSAERRAWFRRRNNLFSLTLALLFLSAWITYMIGLDGIIGSFAFGLIVPRHSGLHRNCTVWLEELVLTLFLPLYFASSGLKTDLTTLHFYPDFLVLLLVCATASMGKFLGTGASAYLCGNGVRDSAAIAVLMNTRGLVGIAHQPTHALTRNAVHTDRQYILIYICIHKYMLLCIQCMHVCVLTYFMLSLTVTRWS